MDLPRYGEFVGLENHDWTGESFFKKQLSIRTFAYIRKGPGAKEACRVTQIIFPMLVVYEESIEGCDIIVICMPS